MRIQIIFLILFLSTGTFSVMQRSLENLLKNLEDPDSHLDCDHDGAEHDDDEGNHFYDIILESKVPEGLSCDDLYDSVCEELKTLGCSKPCDEPNSQHTTDHTWYTIGEKCFIDLSFTAKEAKFIREFYSDCKHCKELVLDETISVPDNEEAVLVEVAVGENQGTVTWGLKRLQDKDYNTPHAVSSYNFDRDYSLGLGARVYVLDTGFHDSWRDDPEFENRNLEDRPTRVEAGISFIPNEPVNDLNGHGTHCAGTVGGNTFGVAAGATIIPVKVLNNRGGGSTSGIIEGIDWSLKDCAGRKCVLSVSLGGHHNPLLNDAVNGCKDYEVPVVVAAGNDHRDAQSVSPANADYAITVSSVDRSMRESHFSNYGSKIDVWAPGSDVKSTWTGHRTSTISGTSMACPHVAGLVAIMMANNDATGNFNDIISQLYGNYGTQNAIHFNNAGSVNLFAQISPNAGSGDGTPASTTEPKPEPIPNRDCEGSWTVCTNFCEAEGQRDWIQTVQQSGSGAACPSVSPECQDGDGGCVIDQGFTNCAGYLKYDELPSGWCNVHSYEGQLDRWAICGVKDGVIRSYGYGCEFSEGETGYCKNLEDGNQCSKYREIACSYNVDGSTKISGNYYAHGSYNNKPLYCMADGSMVIRYNSYDGWDWCSANKCVASEPCAGSRGRQGFVSPGPMGGPDVSKTIFSWGSLPALSISSCDQTSSAFSDALYSIHLVDDVVEYVNVDVLMKGLAFVGVASLFYLGLNAFQKPYQSIADAAEV